MPKNNKGQTFGIAVIFGAIIGYIISLFIPEETHQKHKKMLQKTSDQLEKFAKDPKERERVKTLFNENTKEVTEKYRQARELLTQKLSDLKLALEEIDKDKYETAVKDAIEDIKREQLVPTKQVSTLTKYLKEDFKHFQKIATGNKKSPKKKVKKIAKKVKKQVKKTTSKAS